MNENDKKNLLARFNDCRQNFILSLNSITVLSLIILVTAFIPYTTYVGNLVDVREREVKELTKLENEGKLTGEEREDKEALITFTDKEKGGKFDLIRLQQQWLKKHQPTVVAKGTDIDGKSDFKTPLGPFNISNAGLALIYPAVLSGLIVYLFFSLYNLYDLRRELKDNYQNKKILELPTARMALCGSLLYLSFIVSGLTLLSTTVKFEDAPSVRRGQVVVQALNFQIDRDLDRTIVLISALAVVLAPLTYSVFYWKLFSYVSSRSPKRGKAVSEG